MVQGIFIETIGFSEKRSGVDERTLMAIATSVNGRPAYHFFSDSQELKTYMTQTGMTRME